jgi:DNA polymerase bacteriophage-type
MRYGERYLAGAGASTVWADMDFETFSCAGYDWSAIDEKWKAFEGLGKNKRGLSAVGVNNYVNSATFMVLCLWYDLKDGLGRRFWKPGLPNPLDLLAHVTAGLIIECWNVGFEWVVWNTHCVPVYGWPPLQEAQVRCAMAKSRANSYPGGMKDAPQAIGSPEVKDPAGDKLIKKLTVPKNPSRKNPEINWTPETKPEEFAALYRYGEQDIITEAAASIRLPDLSPRELRIWQVDQRINRRGMYLDRQSIDNCLVIVEQVTDRYNTELRAITGYDGLGKGVEKSSKVTDTLTWMHGRGVHLDELDEESVEEGLLLPDLPADVKRVLQIRQLLSFGSVKKLYAMKYQVCADGRLRDQYAYHAAHTSLWNGQNVQVANLYKGKLDKPEKVEAALAAIASGSMEYVERTCGDAMETIADCLRSMIVAPPGRDLIAADYSAIQAVVLACLAGEQWRIDVFRTHGKIYEMCASTITGKPFQFYLDYKKEHGKHHDDRQPFGKIPELASGFAGWIGAWIKFGAGEFMSDAEIKQAILAWRKASPWIVEFWGGQTRNKFGRDAQGNRAPEYEELYGLEGCAIKAILNPGQTFGYRGVRFCMMHDTLYCQPPTNGEPLQYHSPRLEPATRSYASPWELRMSYMGWNSNQKKGKGGWTRMDLYGGVLTQNVVAKVSREIQADALCALEDTGLYLPVMHTHDEQVTEVPEGRGDTAEYLRIVNMLPSWARFEDGSPWPIKAPGAERTKRYGKWE